MAQSLLEYLVMVEKFGSCLDRGIEWHIELLKKSKASPIEDRFEILWELGSGGFGSVYLAYDKEQNDFVAIKIHRFNASNDLKARFNRERDNLRELQHQRIPKMLH